MFRSEAPFDAAPSFVKALGSAVLTFDSFDSSLQSYVLMLDSTLSRSQYDFSLPQISFTATGYHKHVTLTFNPAVSTE